MFRVLVNQNLTSLSKPLRNLVRVWIRKCSSDCSCPAKVLPPPPLKIPSKITVTICGANGRVGSIIAFLLKQSPMVNTLKLYDLDNTYGMAMDLAHIDTQCRVQSYSGIDDLYECIHDSQIILICAGVGRNAGMSLNDLFEYNAPVVQQIAEAITLVNPTALVTILTNPINSFVPMVSQIFKYACVYDSRKIFGITTIDTMRASSIVTRDVLQECGDPAEFLVPVIGGHSPETMVPVLSQTSPPMKIPNAAFDLLIAKIRGSADTVTMFKPSGGPRLSVALATSRFINNLIRGMKNEKNVVEIAYVYTNSIRGLCYFASPIELGPHGIKQNLGLLKVDERFEKHHLKKAIEHLKCDIKRGENYIIPPPNPCA